MQMRNFATILILLGCLAKNSNTTLGTEETITIETAPNVLNPDPPKGRTPKDNSNDISLKEPSKLLYKEEIFTFKALEIKGRPKSPRNTFKVEPIIISIFEDTLIKDLNNDLVD